jgi:hypothetical protein
MSQLAVQNLLDVASLFARQNCAAPSKSSRPPVALLLLTS